ncbi:MAG: aminotransferase [Alphaproteobacteria bacterium]|nr:aminotransferase [Alphaproteobacteria bacterium]
MKPTPAGWPRIASAVFYEDAGSAIDWLCRAFGFTVRLKVEGEGDRIEHSELEYGEGLIMVGPSGESAPRPRQQCRSPRVLGGANTQSLCVYVDDLDAHCAHARAAGAQIAQEPETHDYGADYWADRTYEAIDPEGHHWWFMHRVREPARP